MSAYGTLARAGPSVAVEPRLYKLRAPAGDYDAIAFLHFDGAAVPKRWIPYLHSTFAQDLADGKTYPQRGPMTEDEFKSYFLAYDAVVGVFVKAPAGKEESELRPNEGAAFDVQALGSLEDLDPSERIGAFYYIKPNYPGRSSHLCNAGFVVCTNQRGLGVGGLAGKSFLHFGPRLGYRGSVFNLVYVTNEASIRIWDKLGFKRVGVIPGAGLLKTGPNGEETYVDAHVVYGDFATIGV